LKDGDSLERQGLASYDCAEFAYIGFHIDDNPSKSTAYTGPTLIAPREKTASQLSLGESHDR